MFLSDFDHGRVPGLLQPRKKYPIVGAGKTISTMLKFLSKHGYNNFTIYNRNKGNALDLANKINIKPKINNQGRLDDKIIRL